MDVTPEEYVEGWKDLYVTEVKGDAEWSLGGCEPYEAKQFPTLAAAEVWLATHGTEEPGTFEIEEI